MDSKYPLRGRDFCWISRVYDFLIVWVICGIDYVIVWAHNFSIINRGTTKYPFGGYDLCWVAETNGFFFRRRGVVLSYFFTHLKNIVKDSHSQRCLATMISRFITSFSSSFVIVSIQVTFRNSIAWMSEFYISLCTKLEAILKQK